jgi:hypothetical protein
VTVVLLKLGLTPLLIGTATLAARRWGPSIGGLLVALPLTSGPLLLFLALDQGTAFASAAAVGSLGGVASVAGWGLAYARIGGGAGPLAGLVAAYACFAAIGFAAQPLLGVPIVAELAMVCVAISAALWLLPPGGAETVPTSPGWWDLPARMVVATAIVVSLTTLAPFLGPHTSGLVGTVPVYVSVLTVFTHLEAGRGAAFDVIRGVLIGLFGTAAFLLVVSLAVQPLGIVAAFGVAIVAVLAIQAVALRVIRRGTVPAAI